MSPADEGIMFVRLRVKKYVLRITTLSLIFPISTWGALLVVFGFGVEGEVYEN
jgi:hypothetical protein